MPLRWTTKPALSQSPAAAPAPQEPQIVLAAPGSVSGRQRLGQALVAGSLLAVAARPFNLSARPGAGPQAPASGLVVINLSDADPGSLRDALNSANANPGPDVITFQNGLSGTISLASQLMITDSVAILGPGPGALAVSGGNATRVFYIGAANIFTVTLSGLTVRDGQLSKGASPGILDKGEPLTLDHVAVLSNTSPTARGGGVEVIPGVANGGALTLTSSIVSGNHAARGAGLFVQGNTGPVLIQDSQILTNTATGIGGGVYLYKLYGSSSIIDSTISGNSGLYGGGVAVLKTFDGEHLIQRSTISRNSSNVGGGLNLYGVHNPLTIEDSTITGNQATTSGGALYLYGNQALTLRNNTIVSNTADVSAGGIAIVAGGSVALSNTIVAGNLAPANPDLEGSFSLSYDLVQVTGTATLADNGGNLFGLSARLLPLADNGGPTQTHLPGPGSPVVNAGDPAFAPPPSTDQRGQPRVSGGRMDMGALEVQAGAVQFSAGNFQVAESALTATISVTRTGNSEGAAAVDYATGGGTATAGADYVPAAGTLHWANGDGASKTFTVTVKTDSLNEPDETVGLTLSSPQGGVVLGAPISATLTIHNSSKLFLPLVER